MMKRIFSLIASLVILLSVVATVKSADLQTYAFPFTGRWNPTENPLLLDDYGLQDIQNLRKDGKHFKGVNGHTVINTSSISTYPYILNGFHFRKDQPQESHVIIYAADSFSNNSAYLAQNTTAIPNTGSFSSLITSVGTTNVGRFSPAPAGNMIYADGNYTYIWGGSELEATAFITSSDSFTYIPSNANDYSFIVNNTKRGTGNYATVSATGGNTSYTKSLLHFSGSDGSTSIIDQMGPAWTPYGDAQIDTASYKFGSSSLLVDGTGDYIKTTNATLLGLTAGNWETDFWVKPNALPSAGSTKYIIGLYNNSGYGLQVGINNNAGTYRLIIYISANGSTWGIASGTTGTYTGWAAGTWYHVKISYDGSNYRFFVNGTADITVASASAVCTLTQIILGFDTGLGYFSGAYDEFRINIGGTVTTADFSVPTAEYAYPSNYFIIGSKRPLQGIKAYIETSNTTTATLSVKEWQGAAWQTLTATDNTSSGGISMAQTGTVTWTYTNSAQPRYIQGLSLYWYQFGLSAGAANIYYVTTDAPLSSITNIWDGSEITVSKFLKYDGSTYKDYTDEINDGSQSTYADLSSLQTTHYIVVGFLQPVQGISFKFVAGSENGTAATQMTAAFWNGSGWQTVSGLSDETQTTTTSMSKGGTVSFSPATRGTEFKYSITGETPLYYYKIYFAGNLDADTKVSEVSGIPYPDAVSTYVFPVLFQNRTFLCNENNGDKNKCIYSVYNAPDIFNGDDSGDLYFGDKTEVTASAVLYNVFLSAGYDQLLVFKKNETYRVYGDGPDNWITQRISGRIGCIAPLSVAVAEVADVSQDVKRNVAIWVSDKGVVMSDGATITSISEDIKVYWDANDSRAIPAAYAPKSVGWYDPKLQSYKLLIASGSTATYLNTELEYSLKHKEWTKIYRENASGANPLQSGFEVFDTNGIGYTYGGGKDGFVYRLENGNNWNSTANIASYLHTKDLILDNEKPLFRQSLVKYLRTTYKQKSVGNITVTHYGDRTATVTGTSGQFAPSVITSASTTLYDTQSLNLGPFLYHSFKFSATTNVADGLELTGFGTWFSPLSTIR